MSAALYSSKKLTRAEFDALAEAHPHAAISLEQTFEWADFEASQGRSHHGSWAYYDDGILVAVASYLESARRFRRSLVVVNGPAWFVERTPAAEGRLLHTVKAQFSREPSMAPLFVRMQVHTPQPPATGPLEHGWYEREIVVDLTPDEGAILRSFRPNARNSIRRAQKVGVTVQSIPREEWVEVFRRDLFPIMEETAERDNFSTFGAGYYEGLLERLGDRLRLLVAYIDERPVSWLITTEYRGHSVYYFAGSTREARTTFAPYLLLWEAFRELKAAGNRSCGLTGIVSENYPQLANVTTFKRNFSKNVVVVPTTYDIPIKPLRYRAVAAALAGRKALPARVARLRNLTARLRGKTVGSPAEAGKG